MEMLDTLRSFIDHMKLNIQLELLKDTQIEFWLNNVYFEYM